MPDNISLCTCNITHSRATCAHAEVCVQDLERQLENVRDEIARAQQRRNEMLTTAKAQTGPAALAKHRYMLRKTRPHREMVQDEVENALLEELNTLQSHTLVLMKQAGALDGQIELLTVAAQQLEANLQDKRHGEEVDMECAMLDGRSVVTRPRTAASSVVSSMFSVDGGRSKIGSHASVRSSTAALNRLDMLEKELCQARNDRAQMESSISAIQAELSHQPCNCKT